MSRTRSLCAAVVATLAVAGVAAPAQAGTKYSPAKCAKAELKLQKKYQSTMATPPAKVKSNAKKFQKGLLKLEHQHGCVFRG